LAEITKLYSPYGWLGYFISYESEAIYHIYSPKKYKVYRISITRVKDREGLDDPYNTPYLEDRVLIPDIEILDYSALGDEEGVSNNRNNATSFNDLLRGKYTEYGS
jgi:hypothetical protein